MKLKPPEHRTHAEIARLVGDGNATFKDHGNLITVLGSETIFMKDISRAELKLKIDRSDKFLLVETLPATTYHPAHLPGAINLPPDQVGELVPTLLPDKAAGIVVYCASPT